MKLCYISTKSIHTRRWVEYFAERGHEVHLITPEYDTVEGVKIYEVNQKASKLSPFFKAIIIRHLIKKIKPDILHAHQVVPFGLYGAFSGFHPFIVSAWGDDIATFPEKSKIHRSLVKYVLRRADLVHVQDPLSKKRVAELGAEKNKTKVVPWGVDLTKFSPDMKSEKWRKKLQKLPGPIIIIIRDAEKRFANTLAKALDTVTKRIPDVNFVIVKSDELRNKIKSSENVQYIDWIPHSELPFYLANSDLFLDPYYPERPDEIGHTYGMALLEAMACGVPTLVAERPTISMLQGEDKWYFGFFFKESSSNDLAKKVLKLLGDKKDQAEMKNKNTAIIKEKFDEKINKKKIEQLYNIITCLKIIKKPYRLLIEELKKDKYFTCSIHDYLSGNFPRNKICIPLRIDVDYEEGLKHCSELALILNEFDLHATFFFLTTTDRYDIFNSSLPPKISKLGFEIGLHTDHYYKQLTDGIDAVENIKKDLERLSKLTKKPIYGMVSHGPVEINIKSHVNISPRVLGLEYHDGYKSPYTKPDFNDLLPNTDYYITDYVRMPGIWNYIPKYPIKELRKAKNKDSVHIVIHPVNIFTNKLYRKSYINTIRARWYCQGVPFIKRVLGEKGVRLLRRKGK